MRGHEQGRTIKRPRERAIKSLLSLQTSIRTADYSQPTPGWWALGDSSMRITFKCKLVEFRVYVPPALIALIMGFWT